MQRAFLAAALSPSAVGWETNYRESDCASGSGQFIIVRRESHVGYLGTRQHGGCQMNRIE